MKTLGKNSTGYGYLLEHDAGYVSPKDNSQFIREMKENIQKKSFNFNTPKLIGVMQKYGVENKNGRIYPEEILRREVEEYMKLVKMGASAGETDHPECYCGDAQILTTNGWKHFKNISENEEIYTLSSDGNIEHQKITKKIAQEYDGKAIKLKGLNIDCTVTPNHRFLIVNRAGEYDYITAQQILDGDYPNMSKCYIPTNIKTPFLTPKDNIEPIFLNTNNIEISEVDYTGYIYCVQVPNSNFYVKQNEKVHWSGNSAVISINNVSMRITNLWWEGRTLMGEIYLPITKGYIEYGKISHPADKIAHDIIHGFQYGVSSRGVGSVEPVNGKNIVQEDFELICWDFVTTPSTKGSWVSQDKKELQQYVENTSPSEYEKSQMNKSKKSIEDDFLKSFSKSRKSSIDSALSNFLNKYK